MFFKIISLGFYNRKKIISNKIDKLNLEIDKNYLEKIDLESKYKIIFVTDNNGTIYKQLVIIDNNQSTFEKTIKIKINNQNLEQQSTSQYQQNSLNT